MMKYIGYTFTFFAVSVFFWGCESDDLPELTGIEIPTDVTLDMVFETNSSGDTTGLVTFTPGAQGVLNYHLFFGDSEDERPTVVQPGSTAEHPYRSSGSYFVRLVAFGPGGVSSSITREITLNIVSVIDPAILQQLTGGETNSTKRWVWNKEVGGISGHFGVGSPDTDFPGFFTAPANGLGDPDCVYDDVLIFGVEDGSPFYQLETMGDSFLNWGSVKALFPEATPERNNDECRESDTLLKLRIPFNVSGDQEEGLTLTLDPLSPLSYFINAGEWQITELSDDILRVRGIQENSEGETLAWYFAFVPEGSTGGPGDGRADFNTLVFAEEFDVDGAPDPSIWNFQTGDGCPSLCGWGNGEAQYYTDRPENVVIESGMLKITALAESFGGRQYTSARLNTQDKFEFTYGRVDVRARVPETGGTWPAAWMLGADIDTNPWPAAGEIDILEHVGNQANTVFGTVHTPSGFGGNANGGDTPLPDATTEFHVYSIDWTETSISFFVDDQKFYTYSPAERNADTYPFNKDFFLLVNMAIGGTFGGNIDPGLTEEVFEIDYIRVYQ